MRVEIEFPTGAESGLIVHAYGAGGRGFEISWGVAERVVLLVQEHMEVLLRSKL